MNREAGSLEVAIRLIDQGRFDSALETLNQIKGADPTFPQSRIWLGRCFFEQGRARQAADHFQRLLLLADPAAMSTVRAQARLWLAFAGLFGVDPRTAENPIGHFETTLSEVEASREADPSARALTADLRSRLAQWRVALGWDPPRFRPQVAALMLDAVQAYRDADEPIEALRTLRRSALFFRQPPYHDMERVNQLLRDLRDESVKRNWPRGEADALLAMAEIEWENLLEAGIDGLDLAPWVDRFRVAEEAYNRAGHQFGDANVAWSFARLLLKFGYTAGIDLAVQSAERLSGLGEVLVQQQIWRELSLWHTRRGDAASASAASRRSQALTQEFGIPLAHAGDALAEADRAFRGGRYGEAESMLSKIAEDDNLRDFHDAANLMRAGVISLAGRHDAALGLLNAVVERLEQRGGGPLLPEALYNRALKLAGVDSKESWRKDMDRLVEIDKEERNPVALGQHLALRGWMALEHRRLTGAKPLITDAIEADFDAAEAQLASSRSLEAREQFGNVLLRRAQLEFIAGRWDRLGLFFDRAEELFRSMELRPALAFTLSHQGLALIGASRARGVNLYDEAKRRFEEAEELLRGSAVQGMLWRAAFHQGLCEREAGTNFEAFGSAAQNERRRRARDHFLRASRLIDVERGGIGSASEAQAQQARIAFVADKQDVYREGFQLACLFNPDYGEAIQWLERMKGRALLDSLAATVPTLGPLADHPLIVADLSRRERQKNAASFAEAESIQREIDEGLDQLAQNPATISYAVLRRPDPPAWEQVRDALRAERRHFPDRRVVIAQYYQSSGQTLLFGMSADWDEPRMASLDVDAEQLRRFLAEWFWTPGAVRQLKNLPSGERRWRRFAPLIAPLADWSQRGDRIRLIPHGILHDIPLHALVVEGEPLADRNIVTYGPSLSVLRHVRHRQSMAQRTDASRRPAAVAVFGNPDPTNSLPGADEEAKLTASILGCKPILGPSATRKLMLEALATCDWFVYAGHGELMREAGLRSRLRLADGQCLDATDVLGLARTPELVVLSACEVGASEHRAGDELLGLPRALLLNGTRAVVASQWRVNDAATAHLLGEFFRAMKSGIASPAEALRQASMKTRRCPEWSHFYYWGGFVMNGEG